MNFTPASTNDWALVLDDAALNYPPPGQTQTNAPPLEPLQITPAAGFIGSGPFGGPFSVTNQVFTLTNIGSAPLNWIVSNTAPWLSTSTNGGTLAPGGTAETITVGLDSAASNLTVGLYSSTVWFTNLNDGVGQGFPFGLTVSAALSLALNAQTTSNAVVLSWPDPASLFVLQSASAVSGPFTNVPGAASPYTNTFSGTQQFFRLVTQ